MNDGHLLFDSLGKNPAHEPLAARMRPRTLDEFVGQKHILGSGRLLRRAIQADQLSSLIFYGPPGTGKTTLARVIAGHTRSHFLSLNAVLSGVADIRHCIGEAERQRQVFSRRSILFVDEVHRFSKSQQDALLPHVENGTVILIGATTENPYFEVNKALVSRSRIFQLKPLEDDDMNQIVDAVLKDAERGYGGRHITLDSDAREHLILKAHGDARNLLNALELAVATQEGETTGSCIDLATAEQSIQQRAVLYDKDGDAHYDTVSAFIKSLRGSDPDASLYWMAKMLHAGEDPRFIFRRMLISASEDVGLAAPEVLGQIVAAHQAFLTVGMPEGQFHLSQACLTLANAPKSHSAMGFFDALKSVEHEKGEDEVPNPLKDASRDSDLGHGKGYLYPHAYRDHWVAQQYLPIFLSGRLFYQPSSTGAEAKVSHELQRRREAQLAASCENDPGGVGEETPGEHHLQRSMSGAGWALQTRQCVFDAADLKPEHLVLDLNAGSGLLSFEAARLARQGGVWSWVIDPRQEEALRHLARQKPEWEQPFVVGGDIGALLAALKAEPSPPQFDRVLGRHCFDSHRDGLLDLTALLPFLGQDARMIFMDIDYRQSSGLAPHFSGTGDDQTLLVEWAAAERSFHHSNRTDRLSFRPEKLRAAAPDGFDVRQQPFDIEENRTLTQKILARYFAPQTPYMAFMRQELGVEKASALEKLALRIRPRRAIAWKRSLVLTRMQPSRRG